MEYLTAKIIYGIACILRWLFLSSGFGSAIHIFILCRLSRLLYPNPIEPIKSIGSYAGIEVQRRLYSSTPPVRKRMIENISAWMNFFGYIRRKRLARKGFTIPYNIVVSPTYQCNFNCYGCYAKVHEGELPLEVIDRIVGEQERLGIFSVIFSGGEPFLRHDLWQVFESYPRTTFTIYTNGTLIGEEEIKRIIRLGNIRLMISLEGFQKQTDERRGKGVYNQVTNLLRLCQQANIFYGVSITVTQDNFEEVTSKEFVEEMVNLGALVISYLLYMPIASDNGFSLMVSAEQVEKLNQWGDYIRDHYPIYPLIGRNGSDMVTACMAADQRIHITANGDVEPCVFCHWAVDNIKDKSILEVMNSDFFGFIRAINSSGETKMNPCKVIDSLFLQKAFQIVGAHQTTTNK